MSRSKKIYVLLGVLLAVCLVTFGVSKYEAHKEEIKNSDEIILELKSEDVTAFSWEYESGKLSFHKEKEWLYDEDEAFPVDQEKIQELLELFQAFGVSFVIEDAQERGQYRQYGLDDPACAIHIETEKQNYEIMLGDYSAMDSQRYVSIGDGNAYLAKDDPMDSLELELEDLIRHDEIPELENMDSMRFSGAENYEIVYEEGRKDTYCADDAYFVKQKGGYLPLDTSTVNDYLGIISELRLTDYVTYDASESELKAYGLDQPDLTVTARYADSEKREKLDSFAISVAQDPKEKKKGKNKKNSDEAVTAYARIGNSKIIYEIDGEDYEALMAASYDDLRHQEILTVDFQDIEQIDIALEERVYRLSADKGRKKTVWRYKNEEVKINDFKKALMGLTASEFTQRQPDGKKEISLTVHLDREKEPKIQIDLYRYDGSSCVAVVGKEPVAFVDRSDVIDLVEAANAIVLD